MKSILDYRGEQCLNCGHQIDVSDKFCPNCGQLNSNKDLTVKQMLVEYLAGLFSYDSKLFKSIKLILTSPGKLSREYLSGKRVRYVNPFRFFISIAILFFILSSYLAEGSIEDFSKGVNDSNSEEVDSINTDSTPTTKNKSLEDLLKEDQDITFEEAKEQFNYDDTYYAELKFIYQKRFYKFLKKPQDFFNFIFPKLPFFMFFYIPIFTLFSKLVYFRRNHSYTEHLVFNYIQSAVFFLLLFLYELIALVVNVEFLGVFSLGFLIYLVVATKRFYNQGMVKTVFKTLISSLFYVFSVIFILTFMVFGSLLFY